MADDSAAAVRVILDAIRSGHLAERVVATILRPHGLTPAAFNVLRILQDASRPLCPSTIGERLLVTRGTMTGVVDSLEKRGHVIRVPHPEDGRMTFISLTPAGAALIAELLPLLAAQAPDVLALVSAEDVDDLGALFTDLEASLDRWILDHLAD